MLRTNRETKILTFPIRHWNNFLRCGLIGSHSETQACLKVNIPGKYVRWVRYALDYELTAGRHLKAGHSLGRSQVKFSKKKPWRQKGTGRARSGSKSSPLWKGGGVVFGPNHSRLLKAGSLNRKIWKTAMQALWYNKRGNIMFVEGPWHADSTVRPPAMILLPKLGLSRPARGLLVMPNHTHVSLLRYLDPINQGISDNPTVVSFSTLKCLDLLRADFVIVCM